MARQLIRLTRAMIANPPAAEPIRAANPSGAKEFIPGSLDQIITKRAHLSPRGPTL